MKTARQHTDSPSSRRAAIPAMSEAPRLNPVPPQRQARRTLILQLGHMKRILNVDTVNNTITLEAGVVLQDAQKAASDAGRLLPLSLAAEGSCQTGGVIAANAGGVHVLRYGMARRSGASASRSCSPQAKCSTS